MLPGSSSFCVMPCLSSPIPLGLINRYFLGIISLCPTYTTANFIPLRLTISVYLDARPRILRAMLQSVSPGLTVYVLLWFSLVFMAAPFCCSVVLSLYRNHSTPECRYQVSNSLNFSGLAKKEPPAQGRRHQKNIFGYAVNSISAESGVMPAKVSQTNTRILAMSS